MKLNNFILFLILAFFIVSCSKDQEKKSLIKEKSLDLQVLEAYQEGMDSLKAGDVFFAAKKFNEAEILFPQSIWAPKSSLMAAYAYYTQDYYGDAIAELERFIRIYSKNINIDYAYYLLAVCNYEQIVDEKKDLQSIVNAKKYFETIIINYPETNYALDSEFKINLINDTLAAKEMYIAKFYIKNQKWIPAINRLKFIVSNYSETVFIEEALHRLVEVYYKVGLDKEAQVAASILGYNYNSSEWYAQSYKVLNKSYRTPKVSKLKKDGLIKRTIKKILN